MKLTKFVAIGLAALLLTAGAAAAMPGNAPVDAGVNDSEQATNHTDQTDDSAEATDESANATELDDAPTNASNETDDVDADGEPAPPAEQRPENARGPPTDMPDQVPDFVTDVHDLINRHLFGDLDGNLGEQISDVTPSEEPESTNADS